MKTSGTWQDDPKEITDEVWEEVKVITKQKSESHIRVTAKVLRAELKKRFPSSSISVSTIKRVKIKKNCK